ncbi:MAG: type II/IV secretion system protein [Candidatus Brennerbacteria bacterium]|nr:type II/IV secretion system protein [Candidatus Brennerbacteria bacterium]
MTDQALFRELVKRNLLDQGLAEKTLKDAGFAGRSAEELLYERRLVDEVSVAKTKSELLGAPYKKVDPGAIPEELLKVIPYDTSKTYRVIPLERQKDMLVVGMLRPDDSRAEEALRFIGKRERASLGVFIVIPSDLAAVWRRYSPYRSEIESAVKELGPKAEEEERLVSLEEGARTAEEGPIIKIVASTLRRAVEAGASDVHFEPQRSRLRVRFRIDGKLEEVASMPIALSQPIVSRVKVLSRLRLDETRIPQDGRFRTVVSGRDIDYRVSTFPTPSGEKAAIRVLDPTTGLKGLKEIGLSEYNFRILNEALASPYGMILIAGPTGSGKTTTLYAMMQKINSADVNVVSLEDPVEYFMDGINQSQVKPEIGYTFASGLRQILRQDPDVIMVGEIRDPETASLAVNSALTGHMMLSTLHTNNAVGVIPRLVDLEAPGFLLSSALRLMMAQRLVSRLCPKCKEKGAVPKDAAAVITQELANIPPAAKKSFKLPYEIYHPNPKSDCEVCKGKGFAGRVAIFEIFRMTRELGDLIGSGFTEGKLWDEAKRQGMVTLRQDGILKSLEGEVLLEEVLRETE